MGLGYVLLNIPEPCADNHRVVSRERERVPRSPSSASCLRDGLYITALAAVSKHMLRLDGRSAAFSFILRAVTLPSASRRLR